MAITIELKNQRMIDGPVATPVEPSKESMFIIGAEARRQSRVKRLNELTRQHDEIAHKISNVEQKRDQAINLLNAGQKDVKRAVELLNDEQLSNAIKDLDYAVRSRNENQNKLEILKRKIETIERDQKTANHKYQLALDEREWTTELVSFLMDIDNFSANARTVHSYQDIRNQLATVSENLQQAEAKTPDLQENVGMAQDDLVECDAKLKKYEEQLTTYEVETANMPTADDIAREIQKLESRKEILTESKAKAGADIGNLEVTLPDLEINREQSRYELAKLENQIFDVIRLYDNDAQLGDVIAANVEYQRDDAKRVATNNLQRLMDALDGTAGQDTFAYNGEEVTISITEPIQNNAEIADLTTIGAEYGQVQLVSINGKNVANVLVADQEFISGQAQQANETKTDAAKQIALENINRAYDEIIELFNDATAKTALTNQQLEVVAQSNQHMATMRAQVKFNPESPLLKNGQLAIWEGWQNAHEDFGNNKDVMNDYAEAIFSIINEYAEKATGLDEFRAQVNDWFLVTDYYKSNKNGTKNNDFKPGLITFAAETRKNNDSSWQPASTEKSDGSGGEATIFHTLPKLLHINAAKEKMGTAPILSLHDEAFSVVDVDNTNALMQVFAAYGIDMIANSYEFAMAQYSAIQDGFALTTTTMPGNRLKVGESYFQEGIQILQGE
ncbi:hypothetical protein EQG49_03170 [Periweissella cryptocerci]|uniref:Uncharacterized protein n=1 Tax=Periweissella cryptocerci TaxID=2506420 RepID=A0A4P6YSA9_9LACO|nr:hypothetical protein [Periweissella cryptocerci]QBO35526.1 hypothetical protein EQG49_03170 [Periweissella cryptocerci]